MTLSTNPYTSQSISGYNSDPPPDDGTTGSDNLVTWAKHKTKLADPIKTLSEAINSQLTTAFAKTVNADAGERNQLNSSVAFAWATATIGSSISTPVSSAAYLSGATTDTLFELNTGSVYDGAILTLKTLSASDSITLIHATATGAATATAANIYLNGRDSITLDSVRQTISLQYDSGVASGWVKVSGDEPAQAVQSAIEAETNENTYIPPDLINYNPGIAKGWAQVESDATLSANRNVSSITDNGTGNHTVNWDTDFSSANYSAVACVCDTATTTFLYQAVLESRASGSIIVYIGNVDNSTALDIDFAIAAFGDQ